MVLAKTSSGPVRVWVATLPEADLALRAWLDDRELERFAGYQRDADRARFLLGAAMLRSAVAAELGMPPWAVPVHRACAGCGRGHGRPAGPDARVALSVSHGGLLVVLALAVDQVVGVDVERVDGRQQEDVRSWSRAEARFKAGGGPGLGIRELPVPLPGHLLTLATAPDATVEVLPAGRLLAVPTASRAMGQQTQPTICRALVLPQP